MNPVGTVTADTGWLDGIGWITWFNMFLGGLSIFLLAKLAFAAFALHRAGKAHKSSAQADAKEEMGWTLGALVIILSFAAVTNIIYVAVT